MSKRKNPFIGKNISLEANTPSSLGSFQINLSHLKNGQVLDLSEFSDRPELLRILIKAYIFSLNTNANIKSYTGALLKNSFKVFWEFLSGNESYSGEISTIGQIDQTILSDFKNWMSSRDGKTASNRRLYQSIIALLVSIQENAKEFNHCFDKSLEISTKFVRNDNYDAASPEAYTRDEIISMTKACRLAIRSCVSRIERANKISKNGEDPRLESGRKGCNAPSWLSEENVLWYVANVFEYKYYTPTQAKRLHGSLFLNATAKIKNKSRPEGPPLGYQEAFLSFYPSREDIIPFVIMLQIKTGLNLDSILQLERDCIVGKGVSANYERVRYKKGRGSYEVMERSFNAKGLFSPIGLINAVLYITDRLDNQVSSEDKNLLFLAVSPKSRGKDENVRALVGPNTNSYHATSYLVNMINRVDVKRGNGLFMQWGLKDRNGNPLKYSSNINRTTYLQQRYKATGSLAYVSHRAAKHHGRNGLTTTANNYLTGEHTEHLHNESIRNAQLCALDQCMETKIIATSLSNKEDDIDLIQSTTGTDRESATNVASGKQDVFIAQCKNFYDSPYSKKGMPCSEPWGCFTCKNAIWTSSILPRLLSFLDFIKDQRKLLGEEDWNNKFGMPWIVITREILPRFGDDKISHARALVEVNPIHQPIMFLGV